MLMMFNIDFLPEALSFIESLDQKAREKLVYVFNYAAATNDPSVLKKLREDIWEFRFKNKSDQYRLLAFWDKTRKSYIVCTHGFVKKTQKTPEKEISRAVQMMKNYYSPNS